MAHSSPESFGEALDSIPSEAVGKYLSYCEDIIKKNKDNSTRSIAGLIAVATHSNGFVKYSAMSKLNDVSNPVVEATARQWLKAGTIDHCRLGSKILRSMNAPSKDGDETAWRLILDEDWKEVESLGVASAKPLVRYLRTCLDEYRNKNRSEWKNSEWEYHDGTIRRQCAPAIKLLASLGPVAIKFLVSLTRVQAIRSIAMNAVHSVGYAAVPVLAAELQVGSRLDADEAYIFVNTLGKIGGKEAMDALRSLPAHPQWYVRHCIARMLGYHSDSKKETQGVSRDECIGILSQYVRAHTTDRVSRAVELESQVTEIGWLLDAQGGMDMMRSVFYELPEESGRRLLEMHWGGIGQWQA